MSYGFRPDRSAWQMLADLKVACEREDTWVIINVDIRKAFDNVRIHDVLAAHRRLFDQHPEIGDYGSLLGLIETVLKGHDPNRQIGIDQGCPYSPFGLNTLLHDTHDVPITRDEIEPFWFREDHDQQRYADNQVYRAQSVKEGRQVLNHVRRLLKPMNLELKENAEEADLAAGQQTPLLGLVLAKEGNEMVFELDSKSLVCLRQHLLRVHERPNPVEQARLALRGWVVHKGPAFQRGRNLLPEIGLLAADLGLRESFSQQGLGALWQTSWKRWQTVVQTAASQYARKHGGSGDG
jgi:hypothetical protein